LIAAGRSKQMHWQAVIGLEIHAQLATRSKIFSGAATAYGRQVDNDIHGCLADNVEGSKIAKRNCQ